MALGVVDEVFQEHPAQALHDGADGLAVQHGGIDDAADILDRHVVDDLHLAGARIDRHVRRMRPVAVGAVRARIGAVGRDAFRGEFGEGNRSIRALVRNSGRGSAFPLVGRVEWGAEGMPGPRHPALDNWRHATEVTFCSEGVGDCAAPHPDPLPASGEREKQRPAPSPARPHPAISTSSAAQPSRRAAAARIASRSFPAAAMIADPPITIEREL